MRDSELRSRNTVWFYAAALAVPALDQITKVIARGALDAARPVTVIPGFLDLELRYNTGAAFGVLPNWAPLFIIAALVAVFAIVKLRRAGCVSRLLSVGLGLVLGGALGNLIDRLTSPTRAVTDFLSFHVTVSGQTHEWPTFNVADIGIVLGAVLILYCVYILEKRSSTEEKER